MSDVNLPQGMLSLSSLTLAMMVAYIRLDPFQHKEQINRRAKEILRDRADVGDPNAAYVRELRYLAGESCLRGEKGRKPKLSWPLVWVKFFDTILANAAAALSFGWLLVVVTHQFGHDQLTSLALAIFGEHGLTGWPFWTLLVSLSMALGLGRFGHLFVSWATKRIEAVDREIQIWLDQQANKSQAPPTLAATNLEQQAAAGNAADGAGSNG